MAAAIAAVAPLALAACIAPAQTDPVTLVHQIHVRFTLSQQ
jgi:hypothetical protein